MTKVFLTLALVFAAGAININTLRSSKTNTVKDSEQPVSCVRGCVYHAI